MIEQNPISYGAHRDLNLAMEIAELMLQNGCETTRVESTIDILLNSSEYCLESESLVLTTGIFATITDKENRSHTMVKRIKKVSTNLSSISKLNELSRNYVAKEIDYESAKKELLDIQNTYIYPKYAIAIFSGLTSMLFCFMIFLNPLDSFVSFLASSVAYAFSIRYIENNIENQFMQILTTSMIVAFFSVILHKLIPSSDLNHVVIGGIMPLVPGTETVTGMRDIIESNFLAATARILNAVIIGVSIAIGVGIVLGIYIQFGGVL